MESLPPPPRHIPMTVAVHQLLGGLGYQISWLIFGFATAFFLFFAFDIGDFLLNRGKTALAQGQLLERYETLFDEGMISAIGIPTADRQPVYRYRYRFDMNGSVFKGQSLAPWRPWQVGQEVSVEYLLARPCISRIQNTSTGLRFGKRAPQFIVLAIALIAGASVFSMTRRRLRWLLLLKNGVAVQATAKQKKLLSRTRHGREWHQIVWEFNARGSRHTLLHQPHYTERVEIGDQRRVLYDRKSPQRAVLANQGALMTDRAGLDNATAASLARRVIPPLVSLSVVLIAAYLEIPC